MLKFIICHKSICLILIIIVYCAASPTKDANKAATKSSKTTKAVKAAKSGQSKKETTTRKSSFEKICQEDEQLMVNTTCGFVKGIWKYTFSTNPKNQAKYRSFKAIPYAEEPTGKRRFKAPEKKGPWPKTLITTDEYGACCLEMPLDTTASEKNRSENCLFLNIFTPADIPKDTKLPVLFFIHGGGLNEGCGDDKYYGSDPFMEKNRGVILVTINYRLGVFGFLAIDNEISGNAAFKDQYMALRWIYDNINGFGGDPKRITLFGQSAGARSTAHHILYPKTREIIERVIVMSGYILFIRYPSSICHPEVFYRTFPDTFKTDAKRTVSELRKFLITVDARELQEKLPTEGDWPGYGNTLYWDSIIEDENATNPFINEHPRTTYERGNIDVEAMFGYTTMELLNVVKKTDFDEIVDKIRLQKKSFMPNIFKMDRAYADKYTDIFAKGDQEMLKLYWPNKPIDKSRESYNTYNEMYTDMEFVYQFQKAAKLHAAKNKFNTFLYVFDVDLSLNYVKSIQSSTDIAGATHCEEIPYLFLCYAFKDVYESISKSTHPKLVQTTAAREFVLEFFLEFAKTGFKNGTDKYKPIKADKMNAIEISNTGVKPIVAPKKEITKLLDKIHQDVSKWQIPLTTR